MTLRVSEIFYSLQGEGKYVGAPSVFLRLFGCNFTCNGFSSTDVKITTARELDIIASSSCSSELDPDLFRAGCDSRYSWDRKYVKFTKKYDHNSLLAEIDSYRPSNKPVHLVITGGEPLLHQKALAEMFRAMCTTQSYTHVTIETNGSIELTEEFKEALAELALSGVQDIVFSNSVKLQHSGEPYHKRIVPEAIISQLSVAVLHPRINMFFKFVTSEDQDVIEIEDILDAYESSVTRLFETKGINFSMALSEVPIYLMPLGATQEQYEKHLPIVSELAMKYGYSFSPRLHIDLFGNKIGT